MLIKIHWNGLTALRSHQSDHFFQDDSKSDKGKIEDKTGCLNRKSFLKQISAETIHANNIRVWFVTRGRVCTEELVSGFSHNGRITGFLTNMLNIWGYHNCVCQHGVIKIIFFFVLPFCILFSTCLIRQKGGKA